MTQPKHAKLGETTGDINQSRGKHEEGTGFIPLGDRDRCESEYGIDMIEERDSDPNIRRI